MLETAFSSFSDFFKSKSVGGVILLLCVAISLFIANSNSGPAFAELLATEIGWNFGSVTLKYPVQLWVNDGLMAIFFLLVGLEIKRELIEGELSSPKQAALPVFAALGGMIFPAVIFALFNNNTASSGGWGIPMATDIAFAIAILSLLGNRVPLALKIFLTALAIVDDLGAILVIAIFYSDEIHYDYLAYAGVVMVFLIILNRAGVMHYMFYLIPGLIMWYFIHHSGIHATIAGVLTALTIPTTSDERRSPLEKLEHGLTRPVNFLIMPLFALANTNIALEMDMIGGLTGNLGLGILFGLLVGKPIGIVVMSWVSVKTGLSSLPEDTKWIQIAALGVLAGIGFTISIFIAMLSYRAVTFQTEAKFAILVASFIAGIVGYLLLRLYSNRASSN